MRVAITQCFHEANAFAPIPITLDDFKRRHYLSGEAVRRRFDGDRDWLAGIVSGFDDADAEIAFGVCTACLPGGVVERASFDMILADMVLHMRAIVAEGLPDIVMLALHGALVVDGVDEPETDIAAAMRDIVGPDVVIAITLDFHANINPGLMSYAQVVVVGQAYPHVDTYARGRDAAQLARRARTENLHSFLCRLPIVVTLPKQATVAGEPGERLCAKVAAIQQAYDLPDLAVAGGFAYGNADYMGMSVTAVACDATLAARAILDVAACVWELRDAFLARIPKLDDGWPDVIERARKGRVVLADVADGPGAGGTADEVTLLRKLLESPVPFVSGFHVDPRVAAEAARIGLGASGTFVFGTARGLVRNPELVVEATVVRTGIVSYCNTGPMMHGARLDGGLGAVLAVPNGFILVTSERIQAYDVNAFISQGVSLQAASIIALKTSAHFRASYTALATGGIVLIDADGWSSPDLGQYAFTNVRAPRLPFQPISESAWHTQIQQQLDEWRLRWK